MNVFNDSRYQHAAGHLEFLAKRVVEGFITGLHQSPFHGFSVEFAEHRSYNDGDSVRGIDWKLFARTDKLYSKRYEEETNLRCQFVLDVSSSMYFPAIGYNKLAFSVEAIASLIYLLKRQRDAFGLSLFADQLLLNTVARSTGTHQKMLFSHLEEQLKSQTVNLRTNLAQNLHQIADLVHKRSLVVIFSDMLQAVDNSDALESLFASLQHLIFNKHEIIIFNIVEKDKELDFNFENRPYEFIDMETGAVMKTNPMKVREIYRANVSEYRKRLEIKCSQYKIDMINADVNSGFSDVLKAYLLKRQKMF